MLRNARTQFFSQLISSKKQKPKVLFETLNAIVSPPAPEAILSSKSDCNEFLHFLVSKIRVVRASISPSLTQNSAGDLYSTHSWSNFKPVTLHLSST